MAISLNGSNQYLEEDSAILTSLPITISAWGYHNSGETGTGMALFLADKDSTARMLGLGFDSNTDIEAWTRFTTLYRASSTASPSNGQWHQAAAVFTNSTLRAAYLDGGNKGTDTNSSTPSNLDRTSIGRIGDSDPSDYWWGYLAHVAIWNVALDDAEVAALGKGYSPLLVRPSGLVGYWPLIRDSQDIMGGSALTEYGSPVYVDDNPPIIMPAPVFYSFPYEKGCVVYGHDTDVVEPWPRDFQGNWTGTADIEGSGDAERLVFEVGENESSECRYIGTGQKTIKLNQYQSGKGNPTIEYATAATKADCLAADWTEYTGSFNSSGWIKVRLST